MLIRRMIIKIRSILDKEVLVLVNLQNKDKLILKRRHSSTIRRYIHTEIFQIGNGGYYSVEMLNIISVLFLYLILKSVTSFIGPNII